MSIRGFTFEISHGLRRELNFRFWLERDVATVTPRPGPAAPPSAGPGRPFCWSCSTIPRLLSSLGRNGPLNLEWLRRPAKPQVSI
jgi:hypothetical protein